MTTATENQDTTALAIRENVDKVQTALSEFDKIQAGLAALELAHPKNLACDVTTTKGMKEAIAGRAAWRDPRIATEKARQAAKAPVLALGKDIDARARQITALLIEGESNYDDQIKAEEARKEAEKAAKAQAEAARVQAHQDRINNDIRFAAKVGALFGSDEIAKTIADVDAMVIDASFEEFQGQAQLAKDETLDKLREMHAAAVAHEAEQARIKAEQEAEAARIAAERAELDKLRAEAAERERVAAAEREAAERAQAEELARQREAQEAELRAAREAQERELAAQRAAQAEADAIAAAERKRLDDEAAARLQEIARQQEEQRAAARRAEEARLAAEERVRQAAPAMADALRQWRHAELTGDADELANARTARDEALVAAGF